MKFRRKKTNRMRGGKSHGWGVGVKHHKGAGNRGGRGMAGTGKRGDAKKPSIWEDTKYFGKYGFKIKCAKKAKPVNIDYFEEHLEKLIKSNIIIKEGGVYTVDIAKLGFDKLLGTGKVTNKFKVITQSCSKGAEEKIKAAGGEVVLTKQKASEKEEPTTGEAK